MNSTSNNSSNLLISNDIHQALNFHSAPGSPYSIYDMAGKIVMTGQAANTKEAVDVSGLAAGMYILRVTNTQRQTVETAKFTKP